MFFVLAILGCGDAGGACQAARIEPVHYTSALQCRAALAGALARNADLDYPEIAARCEQRGAQMASTATRKHVG